MWTCGGLGKKGERELFDDSEVYIARDIQKNFWNIPWMILGLLQNTMNSWLNSSQFEAVMVAMKPELLDGRLLQMFTYYIEVSSFI